MSFAAGGPKFPMGGSGDRGAENVLGDGLGVKGGGLTFGRISGFDWT